MSDAARVSPAIGELYDRRRDQISAKGGQQNHSKFREFLGGIQQHTERACGACAAHSIDIAIYIVPDL